MNKLLRRREMLLSADVIVNWYTSDGSILLKTEVIKNGMSVTPQTEFAITDNYNTYVCSWSNYSDSDFNGLTKNTNFYAASQEKRLYIYRSGYGNNPTYPLGIPAKTNTSTTSWYWEGSQEDYGVHRNDNTDISVGSDYIYCPSYVDTLTGNIRSLSFVTSTLNKGFYISDITSLGFTKISTRAAYSISSVSGISSSYSSYAKLAAAFVFCSPYRSAGGKSTSPYIFPKSTSTASANILTSSVSPSAVYKKNVTSITGKTYGSTSAPLLSSRSLSNYSGTDMYYITLGVYERFAPCKSKLWVYDIYFS